MAHSGDLRGGSGATGARPVSVGVPVLSHCSPAPLTPLPALLTPLPRPSLNTRQRGSTGPIWQPAGALGGSGGSGSGSSGCYGRATLDGSAGRLTATRTPPGAICQ